MKKFTSTAYICLTKYFFLMFVLAFCEIIYAIPANPLPFETKQPDGTKIKLRIRGDEHNNWLEDTKGFPVVHKNEKYFYSRPDVDGKLISVGILVGKADPDKLGLKKNIIPRRKAAKTLDSQSKNKKTAPDNNFAESSLASIPPLGTVKNLVVLCMFSDHTIGTHTRSKEDFEVLFNNNGPNPLLAPTGSVKDFYYETSYGQITLQSTVADWVTLPETESYYADGEDGLGDYPTNAQGMVKDALDLVDAGVNFNDFDDNEDGYIDAITIIHSGYGAEFGGGSGYWIWSHKWSLLTDWVSDEGVKVKDYHTEPALWDTSGTQITRIGVIVHETGHFFGLPDLYDTDQSSAGIGAWGTMANSWGFTGNQLNPPHFCAWSKIQLGWVTPTTIDLPGTYTAHRVEDNAEVFRIDLGYPSDEYLLIENRQPFGFESTIPQGGLAIWHIDDSKGTFFENNVNNDEGYPGQTGWPENGSHYRVALLQADGDYDLEKDNYYDDTDLYHADDVSIIDNSTIPNTNAYKDGNIIVTDNAIFSISTSGPIMTFEFNSLFYSYIFVDVNAPNDPGTGSYTDPFKRIQDAIDDVAVDGDIIIVRDGIYKGQGNRDIDPCGLEITIKSQNSPESCIIDCNDQARGFIFQSEEGPNTVINGFTITNGYSGSQDDGGAIYCYQSSPIIENCIITLNNASYSGGGIFLDENSNPKIDNCTINYNQCGASGGAICSVGSHPEITNSLITHNSSYYSGCAGSLYDSDMTFINCTIADNQADYEFGTGGIDCFYGDVLVANTIMWNNSSDSNSQFEIYAAEAIVNYSDIQMPEPNEIWDGNDSNNINADPLFADPNLNDYHLKSAFGRWIPVTYTNGDFDNSGFINFKDFAIFANEWKSTNPDMQFDLFPDNEIDSKDLDIFAYNWLSPGQNTQGWELDDVNSPCIDAGNPSSDYSDEPFHNGDRINMGAYGNTSQASKSDSNP
ncbi:MAG: M6 family metalloprotease domain-containing protein [Planctomycetota bacterium]|jgi:M6 family metalloprotease-like protein